jgi:hypothetical protein
MPLPNSSHDCTGAGTAANGFSLGAMIVSFVRAIPEDMTKWIDTV